MIGVRASRAAERGDAKADSWREADAALRRIARQRAALDAEEAVWLLRARDANVHLHLGFGTFFEYLERVFGWGPHTASERIRVAEALAGLPALADAVEAGQLSFSAVRELTRVATPETGIAWLTAAEGRTMKEIEPLVARHRPGNLPDSPVQPGPATYKLRYQVAAETHALLREAFNKVRADAGMHLSDDEVLAQMARAVLGGVREEGKSSYQIALTVCPTCDRAEMHGGGNLIEVSPETLERARCDANLVGSLDGDVPERAAQEVPPAVRERVWLRNHGRCVVPGCRSALYLDVHHLRFRAHGGGHAMANLALLCGAHHDHVHTGRLIIQGAAPELSFFHADGRRYGQSAPTPPPAAPATYTDALSGLTNLGWKPGQARAALDAVSSHMGPAPTLEDLLRAALRELARTVRHC